MKHDYTDEEIKEAENEAFRRKPIAKGHEWVKAFLAALPARLPPLPKTLPPRPPRPEPKASQQEAIDAAFLDSRHISLWAVADSPYWEKEAPDRLALAQVYEQVRPQSAEMVELRAELDYARKTIEEKSAEIDSLKSALPDRPQAQPSPWPGQQEAIDAAFQQIDEFYLDYKSSHDDWEHEAPARLAIAQAYDAARPQAAEIASLKAELEKAERKLKPEIEALHDTISSLKAELAALRTPILADDGRSLDQVYQDTYNYHLAGNGLDGCCDAGVQAVAAVVLAQAVRRMESVMMEELSRIWRHESSRCYRDSYAVCNRLIAAVKGEGQAKPSTRIEITEIPDKKPGPVGTLAYAPQAEALPSTQQNKSESSALEKQAVQEAAYILNHYDRKSHADHICLGKKLIREGWKGPNFGKQKSDLKLTLHRSAAEDTPQAEAKAEPAKLLGQHGPKGAPALCGPSANPVVVNEPPQDEKQPNLSGESEKQDEPAQAQQEPAQPWTPENAKAYENFQAELRETWAVQPWTPAVGDVVRLKSGGPVMTVTDVDPLSLMCAWMNADNELQVEPITTLCLTPVPTP